MIEPFHVDVSEQSRVGEARRLALGLAGRMGFDEQEAARVALVATEAATNLVRHAVQGELLVRGDRADGWGQIDILSVDKGPGMVDVDASRHDGYSTGGSRGEGLGAMDRAAAVFDIHSTPGAGTVVMARFQHGAPRVHGAGIELGGVSVPCPGETVCGDAWTVASDGDSTTILVVDGLGHGQDAADASREAVENFHRRAALPPAEIVGLLHDALRPTRGAALAVARIEPARGLVCFCGIGNVAGAVIERGTSRHLVSMPGTAGHTAHRIQEFHYPWPERGWLVIHSDGIGTHWKLEDYAGLEARHPLIAAGLIYRDHRRGRDDATVVVARPLETKR